MMGEWQVGSRAEGFDDFCTRKCLEFPVNYCLRVRLRLLFKLYRDILKCRERGDMKRGGLAIIKIQMDGGGHPLLSPFLLLLSLAQARSLLLLRQESQRRKRRKEEAKVKMNFAGIRCGALNISYNV